MEEISVKHILDLANRTYQNNIYTFTDFLSMAQVSDFYQASRELPPVPYTLFGGMEGCERLVIRFGNEDYLGYNQDFPIECLLIEPLSEKFAKEYSHRDYLGALMKLGMERKVLGDILVDGKKAYVFCLEKAAELIISELDRVGHNPVKIKRCAAPTEIMESRKKSLTIQVQSMRVDAVIAKTYNLSRSDVLAYFPEKKVAVNGRIVENNDKAVVMGDVISVRGLGKFEISTQGGLSKKGKIVLGVSRYL